MSTLLAQIVDADRIEHIALYRTIIARNFHPEARDADEVRRLMRLLGKSHADLATDIAVFRKAHALQRSIDGRKQDLAVERAKLDADLAAYLEESQRVRAELQRRSDELDQRTRSIYDGWHEVEKEARELGLLAVTNAELLGSEAAPAPAAG